MKTVFSDLHQADLGYSLQLLAKRANWDIYFPIGMDWYENNFWSIYPSIETAKQYLRTEQAYQPLDGTLPLNIINEVIDDCYIVEDKHNNSFHKAITFETFKEMDINIVIASIPQHIKPFKELAKMKNAKFIFQMGNYFPEVNLFEIPNLMVNSLPPNIPFSCHYIQYHQEFSLDIFKPLGLPPEKEVASFINILSGNAGKADYYTLRVMLPEYQFKSYGAQNDDGVMNTTQEIAGEMNKSAFGFHSKWGGDGFGHILYNWFACGKPIITRVSDYKDRLGGELLIDMQTCIDLDKHSYEDVCDIIKNIEPHKYEYMSQQAYLRFQQCVDYNVEELHIREFLNNLQ